MILQIKQISKLGIQINTIPPDRTFRSPSSYNFPKACVHFGHKLLCLKNVRLTDQRLRGLKARHLKGQSVRAVNADVWLMERCKCDTCKLRL